MSIFIRHLRLISTTLEWLVVLSLLATAIPLALTNPGWYLKIADTAISNSPIILLSVLTRLLAWVFSTDEESPNEVLRATESLACRWGWVFAVVIPLQLMAYGWLWIASGREVSTQLQQAETNLSIVRSKIRTSQNKDELTGIFRDPSNASAPMLGDASLNDEKKRLNEKIDIDLLTLRSKLNARRFEILEGSLPGVIKAVIGAAIVGTTLWNIKRELHAGDH